jgi:hypothetical protein
MTPRILLVQPRGIPDSCLERATNPPRPLWQSIVIALLLSIAAGLSCERAAGASLGLLLGPAILITLLAPPLMLAEDALKRRLLVCAALCGGICGVWIFTAHIEFPSIIRCALVLAAYALALGGSACVLARMRVVSVLASAATTVLGLAWLTWPVWLSRMLPTSGGQLFVRWSAPVHPLFAINGVVRERFDAWDRYRLAYQQLTTLNQDVLYMLPRTVWPSVALHGAIGATSLVLCYRISRSMRGPITGLVPG